MKYYFDIYGQIVEAESAKETSEDLTPQQFSIFTGKLKEGDELEIVINSCGGDVFAGIAIANQIRDLSRDGIKTIARVDGICASIATVIMCACDVIRLSESSLIMIHNCWSCVQGNSNDLRHQADIMEQMNKAIISFYLHKWSRTEEELQKMMDDETWMSGTEAKESGLACEIIDGGKFRMCAYAEKLTIPERYKDLMNEKTEEEKPAAEAEVVAAEAESKEEATEESADEIQRLKTRCEELTAEVERLTKELEEPTDKRVSGMQAKMQLKLNACEKHFKNLLQEKENEIKSRGEELTAAKAEVISLRSQLGASVGNCEQLASALHEKESALDSLNARVLHTPESSTKKSWRELEGQDFKDYLDAHNNIIKFN